MLGGVVEEEGRMVARVFRTAGSSAAEALDGIAFDREGICWNFFANFLAFPDQGEILFRNRMLQYVET